jgi:hypothetical protein
MRYGLVGSALVVASALIAFSGETANAQGSQANPFPGTFVWDAGRNAPNNPLFNSSWSLSPDNSPTGLYLGASFAGNGSNTRASNPTVFTIGILDNVGITQNGTSSYVSGGALVGWNFGQFIGLGFGIEFAADFADKNQTLVTNINNITTGTLTDRLGFEYNHLMSLSGVLTAPVTRNISLIGKGGASWLNGTAHTGCIGSCEAAGTPVYNVAQDVDFDGYHLGIGAQVGLNWGSYKPVLRAEYTRHWFDTTRISTGNSATASIAYDLQPEIDQFKVSLIMSLGGIPNYGGPMSWSAR